MAVGKSYPNATFRRFVIQRIAETESSTLEALLNVIHSLADWQPQWQLRFAGDPPRPVKADEEDVGTYLREIQRAWSQGIPTIFRLADKEEDPQLALYYGVEPMPSFHVEYIWFSLPDSLSGRAFHIEQLIDLMASLCQGFQAYHGYIEDESLLMSYRGKRGYERALENTPSELHQFVPSPDFLDAVSGLVPSLLMPQEFNCRRVPEAVWWLNFWDEIQVSTVTIDRMRSAPWFRLVELPRNRCVLAATGEPVDLSIPDHMTLLREIIEHIGLVRLQHQYRYKV